VLCVHQQVGPKATRSPARTAATTRSCSCCRSNHRWRAYRETQEQVQELHEDHHGQPSEDRSSRKLLRHYAQGLEASKRLVRRSRRRGWPCCCHRCCTRRIGQETKTLKGACFRCYVAVT
jgi:hypothetical protein